MNLWQFGILILAPALTLGLLTFSMRARFFSRQRKARRVVYFGGSITAGAGASRSQAGWASLTARWLDRHFSQYAWTHINAGLGGKSSWYGLIRLQKDLIEYQPDLVFLDFAVNDAGTTRGELPGGFSTAAEALIRRVRAALPQAKLVILVLSRPDTAGSDARDMWVALGHHYDIQVETLERELTAALGTESPTGAQLAGYFLSDVDVHPNDNGHALIASMIRRDLKSVETDLLPPIDHYEYLLPAAQNFAAQPFIHPATENDGAGGEWMMQAGSLESSQPGAWLRWTADLCSFGFETNLGQGAGVLEWAVDENPFTALDLEPGLDHLRVVWNLPRGRHTVTVRVAAGRVVIHRFYGI